MYGGLKNRFLVLTAKCNTHGGRPGGTILLTRPLISVDARLLSITRPTFYDLIKKCDNPIAGRVT